MVQAGVEGLDTPKTILGDATYLSNQQPDFDISVEQSFQSPSKDNNNLVQQLQNGRRGAVNLKTPRSRAILGDRRNLPAGGGEFTPLLKSATRNSGLRHGKENIPQTPAFLRAGGLANIPEDLSPVPPSSAYGGDSRNASYMNGTSIQQMNSSSTASTPMALLPRRNEGPGVLQDGNQLSLREQENVIDKIEKENFGLKLKIHFLEEALRKAGPGFSEAALKENTELKVDAVTMQKELHRYRKTLTTAERDVELYRQQIIEMQEKVKRKHADEGQREELDRLRQALEEREMELRQLRSQGNDVESWQEKVHDLEADLREKDRVINDREDELENLKDEVEKQSGTIADLQETVKEEQRRVVELEERTQSGDQLADAKEDIKQLERDIKRLEGEAEDAKEEREEAAKERDRAREDLEDLQDEMANKFIDMKGLSDQLEEAKEDIKQFERDIMGLQGEVEDAKEEREEATKERDRVREDLRKAIENREAAYTERDRAREDLEELQDEMANKSITTKGLSRQIEEKANRLQDELNKAKEDIKQFERDVRRLQEEAKEFKEDRDEAAKERNRAREDLEELQDEIANKSVTTKGLNRQFEEKANRLQDELDELKEQFARLEKQHAQSLQSEAAQKEVIRGLKRQIQDHEWKAQAAEASRQSISPKSSSSGSARKSEIAELQVRLTTSHQALKDVRAQLKETEKSAAKNAHAATVDLQTRVETWEAEKDALEHCLSQALISKDELSAQNASSELTINRLRTKIDRLEKALTAERLNSREDRTMALERCDLHAILRETQLQADSLEVVVQERDAAIAAISATESELRIQLKRVRDERASHQSRAVSALEQLNALERQYRKAEKAWDVEKKGLCKGVRFPNMSLSVNEDSELVATLRKDAEEKEKRHVKEMRGVAMQVEWLRARYKREEGFRVAAAYAKKYMGWQIELFEACNKADLALIRSAGVVIERPKAKSKPSFSVVAKVVRATVRMKLGAERWAESRKIGEKLTAKKEMMRKQAAAVQGRSSGSVFVNSR